MSEVYYEVHMTCVLHNSRISKVDSVMFVNRMREMVSFELGKEIDEGLTFETAAFKLFTVADNTKLPCFPECPLFNSV